jgi:hypothetical protein
MYDPSASDLMRGSLHVYDIPNPAAGAEIAFVLDPVFTYELLSFHATLTTDANVATRTVVLFATDGARPLLVTPTRSTQLAGLVRVYHFQQICDLGSTIPAELQFGNIPTRNVLPPLTNIITATQNIQVGDQWSDIYIRVLRLATPGLI